MSKERKEMNDKNPPVSPSVVSSPIAMAGLGAGAVALVNHMKYKTYPKIKTGLNYTDDSIYFINRKLKALDNAQEAATDEERKKYLKEAGKYNYAAKKSEDDLLNSFMLSDEEKNEIKNRPDFWHKLKEEAETAREMEKAKYDKLAKDALKKRNLALGLMGASFLASGLAYANQKKKQKEYLQSLVKQSSNEINPLSVTDDELKQIKKETAENKSSFVPATALGMFATGVLADKLADKLNKSYSKKESLYKKHLADFNTLKKEKEKIYEKLKSDNLAKNEKLKLNKNLKNIEMQLEEKSQKAMAFAGQIGLNPANALKNTSSTLKWGALPLGIVGTYQLMSKKINPKNPGLIKDPETNDNINRAAGLLEAAGALALVGGMYRPVIKPMFKGFKLKYRNTGLGDVNKNDLDKIENKIKNLKDEDLLSSKKRDEFIKNLEKEKSSAIENIDKFRYDKDAKIAAIGSTLLSAGMVGDNLTASPMDAAVTAQKYANKKNLLKQSGAVDVIESVATPVGSHILQNLYIKGQLHSGSIYKKFNKHLLEGNRNEVSKSILSHIGDGAVEGILNPDAKVIKDEARELGKILKNHGVKLDELGPEDKAFLKALSNGDYAKALDIAPHSGLAHMFFATNAAKQDAALQEFTEKAKHNLSKKDWDKINKEFKNTAMYQLGKVIDGKEADEYLPPRKHGVITKTYNKVFKNLNKQKEKGTPIGKVYDFLGKDVDDVLHLPKVKTDVKTATKLEEIGRKPAIAALFVTEPLIGAWNAGKPLISKTRLANEYTSLDAAQHFARGLTNDDLANVNKKTYLSDAASDYLLSPSLGMVNRLAYDEGKINHEILKRGLSKKTAKKIFENDKVKGYARSPWATKRNAQVDSIKKDLALDELENRLKTFDYGLLHDYQQSGKKVLKNAIETRSIDPKEIKREFETPVSKTKDKMIDKATKDLGTKNLHETEKISEAGKKMNDIMSDWGAPGSVAIGLGMVSPALYSDYKEYRKKRKERLKKTASDDSDKLGIATGAISGAALGAMLGKLDNEKQIENAEALISKIQLIKDSDPIEAKEILEKLKQDKAYKHIKDLPAIKEIESTIDEYHKKVMDNIHNSPEAKKLKEYESMVEKFRVKNPQPEGPFKSLIIRPLKEVTAFLLSKGKKNITKKIPKNIYDLKESKKQLENKIIDRNIQIKKQLNKEFENGKLYKSYLKAQEELSKHIKPSGKNILGKSVAGAGVGAVLSYLADKGYNNLSKIHKDGDKRNDVDYKISPFVGTGILAGGLLGLTTNKIKRNIVKDFIDRTIDNDFIHPKVKNESIKTIAAATDMENALNAAIEESAKYNHTGKISLKKIKEVTNTDLKSFNAKKASNIVMGAGIGGTSGYLIGNNYNINKKNDISTTNMLLKKQNSADEDKDYTDKLIYTGLIGTGAGTGTFLGYKSGKIKKAKLTPAFENIKQTVNAHIKDSDGYKHIKDFMPSYNTPETIDSLQKSLNKFKAGKNALNKRDLNKRQPILKQYKELKEKLYEAEKDYLPREKQMTELQDLYKQLAQYKREGNMATYNEVMNKIEDIRAPKDKEVYNEIEQALNRFLKAKEELRNSDVINKYKHIDFKLLHQTDRKIPEIEKELELIPISRAVKGGLAGTALGSALAYLAYKDLNTPE